MREKFSGAQDVADAVVEATRMAQEGKPFEAKNLVFSQLVHHPMAPGVAEALKSVGQFYMQISYWHHLEACCLLAYRLRATAVMEDTVFDNLVNLTVACVNQKSYEEAYTYGRMAEAMNPDDPDLLATMLGVEVLAEKEDGALDRRGRLQRLDPSRLAGMEATLRGETAFRPTHGEDASDLVARAEVLHEQDPRRLPDLVNELSHELCQRPDARGAAQAWKTIAMFHEGTRPQDPNQEFVMIYSVACATAAMGKAIMADPKAAARDAELWGNYGTGLTQLCFYDQAVEALERSYAIERDPRVKSNLDYAREMARVPDHSPQRPDSKAAWEAMREKVMGSSPGPRGAPAPGRVPPSGRKTTCPSCGAPSQYIEAASGGGVTLQFCNRCATRWVAEGKPTREQIDRITEEYVATRSDLLDLACPKCGFSFEMEKPEGVHMSGIIWGCPRCHHTWPAVPDSPAATGPSSRPSRGARSRSGTSQVSDESPLQFAQRFLEGKVSPVELVKKFWPIILILIGLSIWFSLFPPE